MSTAPDTITEKSWPWPVAVVVWLAFSVVLATMMGGKTLSLDLDDSDDYMRLVQVEDWMGGAGWTDTQQGRLNPPDGVQMHWSRLPDVPIAAVISVAELFSDHETAVGVALVIVPLVYLGLFMLLVTLTTAQMVGRGPAVLAPILAAFAVPATGQFVPGRIDHHGLQILLATLMLAAAIQLYRTYSPKWAAIMGLAAGLSITIGAEALPHVIAGYGALGLGWVLGRNAGRDHLLRSGIIMALVTAATTSLLLVATVPGGPYFVGACDALSVVYAVATALVAAVFLTLAALESRLGGPWARAIAALVLAGLAGAVLLLTFPQCAAGPYAALPPELVESWLVGVQEAQSAFDQLDRSFAGFALYFTLPLIGAGVLAFTALKTRPLPDWWWPLAVFLGLGLAVALVQVRAANIANAFAILAAAPGYFALFTFVRQRVRLMSNLVAVAVMIVLSPLSLYMAASAADPPENTGQSKAKACGLPASLRELDGLESGIALAPHNLGPMILAFTDHSVIGAPYHRNVDGLMTVLRFLRATDPNVARQLAMASGADYVVVCNGPGVYGIPHRNEAGSLAAALAARDVPSWLQPVGKEGRLDVYKVTPVLDR